MPLARDSHFDPTFNPVGCDGFEYVEFAADDTTELCQLFEALGFTAVAKHRTKDVVRYQQGDINFLINREDRGHPAHFRQQHGPCACAMAFRVKDAQQALEHAKSRGAKMYQREKVSAMELNIPAIYGIGDSLLFLVDRYKDSTIYDVDFIPFDKIDFDKGAGLKTIDHLTHNVYPGHMDEWANFYERIFNFREIKFFDIRGQKTGLISRALSSPCGKIKIPINESEDQQSQINEYLREYNGEGIQHIALTTENIYQTMEKLKSHGVEFLDVPDTYYRAINERLPGHGEPIAELQKHRILIDGVLENGKPQLLLQIFTQTVIGPIFFEIIQRKGDEGFGEGNFQALFDAIERDQMERGVL